MAIAWVLRDKRVTSALIGARNVEQLDNSLDALKQLQFTDAELAEIDLYAQEGSIDLWKGAARESHSGHLRAKYRKTEPSWLALSFLR